VWKGPANKKIGGKGKNKDSRSLWEIDLKDHKYLQKPRAKRLKIPKSLNI